MSEGGGDAAQGTPRKLTSPRRRDLSEGDRKPAENRVETGRQAAWGTPAKHESPWYPAAAVIAALILWLLLPKKFTLEGVSIVVPVLEIALLLPLIYTRSSAVHRGTLVSRWLSLALIGLINTANIISLARLIEALTNQSSLDGTTILLSSADIWLTNVIVFGLWFWELDRGGPVQRRIETHRSPDFLFPQMVTPECGPEWWAPNFVDYFYVAFTNATAFSPTDTMPLTRWAKGLMMLQSFASLVTVALVAARAVNILKG